MRKVETGDYARPPIQMAAPAGLSAERAAREAGVSTLLIDDKFAGTMCADVGCMPSKLLIAAATAANAVRRASTFGVFATHRIDSAAVMARVRRERDAFADETLFELTEFPHSMAVVGAGPLGLELGQALARLGVRVSLFDEKPMLGGVADEALAACMRAVFGNEIDLHLGVKIRFESVAGRAEVHWEGASSGAKTFDRVLVAVGRPPNLAALNPVATGLALNERGVPAFDSATMQCGRSSIFIAGDADSDRPVLHEAQMDGSIAGFNPARFPRVARQRRSVRFSLMFTDPPLAVIGRQAGDDLICGATDFSDQGRAKVEARAHGLLKIYAQQQDVQLQGATLFCPGADHLGHLLAWQINDGAKASALLEQPFYHPTLEEGLKPALRQICERRQVQLSPQENPGSPSGG